MKGPFPGLVLIYHDDFDLEPSCAVKYKMRIIVKILIYVLKILLAHCLAGSTSE